jgi:glycosyltransferase involved in cell wall biosynthesis
MNSPDGEIFPYRSARSYISRTSGQRFVMMYHGSLVERNGLELAVDALALAQQKIQDVELRIFGADGPYLQRVMEKVSRLGLNDHVRYLGPRKLEDLAREIESCDVGVIPNQRNIFTDINTPTRIFEYLALGKPVIAPSTRGITDYLGHDSLFFFESGNAQDLAITMEDVARHPAKSVDVAERGQQIYLAHTWSQERQGLVNCVSELLRRKKSS